MTDTSIVDVLAWEALDSRGNPTVACEVRLESGATGTAIVPAGASTGGHEARELRDGGARYGGKGVIGAVRTTLEVLAPAVRGLPAGDQRRIDEALRAADGTDDLSRLGANAVLAVSLAVLQAAAAEVGRPLWRHTLADGQPVELPLPMVNILSGGAHAGTAIDIQDVLAVPVGADDFRQAIEWVDRVRRATAEELAARGLPSALVADEGGYGPTLPTNRAALEIVTAAIDRSGLEPSRQVGIAIDVAANGFFQPDSGLYHLVTEDRKLTATEWTAELCDWVGQFPLVSVEDPMAEDDWDGWQEISQAFGDRIQVLGDDLFTTNLGRLRRGVAAGVANSVLIKLNQIGTVTDAFTVLEAAKAQRYATVLSARSGDTEEHWLADLAVGWRAGQIKVGSLARSERTAKWNRLLRIQAELGDRAGFAGRASLAGPRP
jgi:enolase